MRSHIALTKNESGPISQQEVLTKSKSEKFQESYTGLPDKDSTSQLASRHGTNTLDFLERPPWCNRQS